MKDLEICRRDGLDKKFQSLWMRSIDLLVLSNTPLTCSSKLTLLSRGILKYFGKSFFFFTGLPLKIILGWWCLFLFCESITSYAYLKGLGLKLIFHWCAQGVIFSKLPLILFAEIFRSHTTENKEVPLSKSFGFEDRFLLSHWHKLRTKVVPKWSLAEHLDKHFPNQMSVH